MTHALFISDPTFWMIDFHESHVPIEHAIFVVNVIPIKSLVANAVENILLFVCFQQWNEKEHRVFSSQKHIYLLQRGYVYNTKEITALTESLKTNTTITKLNLGNENNIKNTQHFMLILTSLLKNR